MSSTVTGSSSRDWSAERSSSSSSMSPPPVAMGRGDGGPAVHTLGSTPSANCQPLSISVSTNPVASQSVASKALAAQQLWTTRINATNKFTARNNCTAHLHKGARMVVAQQVPQPPQRSVGGSVLTIAKLKRWSINYYIDTARAAEQRRQGSGARSWRAGGVLLRARNPNPGVAVRRRHPHRRELVGLTDAQRAGGEADPEVVARWLDDGVAPNGACGRAFGERGVHGFDLTFCAPKSVSLVRALRTDDVAAKAIADAHATALAEAMEYLAAHAGYTRVHNPRTGEKDLCGCRVWWRSPISTRPRGAGTRICTPM